MNKRALLIGINRYQMLGNNLRGCINDVTNIRDILIRFYGFKVEDIRVVTDERATKNNIMIRLKWLVTDSKAGDKLLFHYSGHGSQIRDRNGDEVNDRLDELLCPNNMTFDGNYILDDELKSILSKLPSGVTLDVILDCCHSGTGTRDFSPFEQSGNYTARYLEPPIDILLRNDENRELPIQKILKPCSKDVENGVTTMTHNLIAGCKDNQTAADALINNTYNGALTYYLCKIIRETQGKITRNELISRVQTSLRYNKYAQVPQLAGAGKEKQFLD